MGSDYAPATSRRAVEEGGANAPAALGVRTDALRDPPGRYTPREIQANPPRGMITETHLSLRSCLVRRDL